MFFTVVPRWLEIAKRERKLTIQKGKKRKKYFDLVLDLIIINGDAINGEGD